MLREEGKRKAVGLSRGGVCVWHGQRPVAPQSFRSQLPQLRLSCGCGETPQAQPASRQPIASERRAIHIQSFLRFDAAPRDRFRKKQFHETRVTV